MELLPLITDEFGNPYGWKVDFKQERNRTIRPGEVIHLGPWENPGWMRFAILLSNNPYTKLYQTVHHIERPISWSFYELYLYGATSPGPVGLIWLQTYDTLNNIYLMLYQPVPPQELSPGSDVWIELPETDPFGNAITSPAIITYLTHVILIDSKDRFTRKLQEVLGTRGMASGTGGV